MIPDNILHDVLLILMGLFAGGMYGLGERDLRKTAEGSRDRAWQNEDYWRKAYYALYREVLDDLKGKKKGKPS